MPTMAPMRALRTSAVQMAAGMAVLAAAGYAFVVLAGRTLPKDQATLATSVYFLVNIVGPGIFFALEQVASRTTAAALARGGELASVARRSYRSGLRLLAAVLVGLGALAPLLGTKTLHGNWPLYALVLAMPVISVHLHLGRGQLAGMRRFGSYAATLAVEGGGRVILCLAAAVAGAGSAWLFGVAFIVPSALAAGLGLLAARRTVSPSPALEADQPPSERMAPAGAAAPKTEPPGTRPGVGGDLGRGIAALALASLLGQLLPNIAPLVVNSRLPASSSAALAFSQAAVAARVPLLVFVPIQVMILPGLTTAAARGELAAVRAKARQVLAVTTSLGLVFALGYVLLGSWGLRTFFGTPEPVGHGLLLVLALSTTVVIAAYTLQPALVAIGGEASMMAAWAVGSVATGTIALLPVAAISAAEAGQLLGPALTVAILGGALVLRLRRPPGPAAGSWQADRSVSEPSAALGG